MRLTECKLVYDAVAGGWLLYLNGHEYDVARLPDGAVRFHRRAKRRPPAWVVRGGRCDCPAAYFRSGECKHAAATRLLERGCPQLLSRANG